MVGAALPEADCGLVAACRVSGAAGDLPVAGEASSAGEDSSTTPGEPKRRLALHFNCLLALASAVGSALPETACGLVAVSRIAGTTEDLPVAGEDSSTTPDPRSGLPLRLDLVLAEALFTVTAGEDGKTWGATEAGGRSAAASVKADLELAAGNPCDPVRAAGAGVARAAERVITVHVLGLGTVVADGPASTAAAAGLGSVQIGTPYRAGNALQHKTKSVS